MVDDVQSFVAAAEVLKERGAYKIYVLATHGLLSSDAPRLIEDSPIDEASLFICFLLYHYKIMKHFRHLFLESSIS
jgi:phosphoribosylpyrophosphate synthetase